MVFWEVPKVGVYIDPDNISQISLLIFSYVEKNIYHHLHFVYIWILISMHLKQFYAGKLKNLPNIGLSIVVYKW